MSSSAWAVDYSLDFNGSSKYVDIGSGLSFAGTSNFTFSAWVNPDTVSGGVDDILTNYELAAVNASNSNIQAIGIQNNTAFIFRRTTAGTTRLLADDANLLLSANNWYHIVGTYDGTTMRIYVNGVAETDTLSSGDNNGTAPNFRIGLNGDNSYGFDGQIGEVAVWNEALTATEITALYNSGTPKSALTNSDSGGYQSKDNLSAYYTMNSNSGTGTTLTDDSVNSNTGTLTNMTTSGASSDWKAFSTTQSQTTRAVTEGGSASTYTLVLDQQPTSDVTVTLTSSDTGAATVTSSLTFTTSNWNTAQTVTVTPVDDADEAAESVTISHSLSGGGYANASVTDVTVTVTDDDSAAPTVTFNPLDGATSVSTSSNITITFNKAVRNTDDTALTDSNVDSLITLKETNSSGSDIAFDATINAGKTVITINPTSDFSGEQVIYVAIGATVEDSVDNAISASNATFTVETTALPTPLGKKDVVASVEGWTNTGIRWAKDNTKVIENRLSWLNRNQDSINTSHQGIKLHFNNKIIDAVMNTSPQTKEAIVGKLAEYVDPTKQAINLLSNLENTQGAMLAGGEAIKSDAQMIAINEAARLREKAIGSLNPSFKPVYNDWSLWTAGQITVGEVDATTTASKQDSKDVAITLGFDKPFYDDGLVGWSLSLGQSKTDIGTSTTEVKSDNYALSGYSVIKQDNGNTIESILGLGHLKFDTIRKDGSDTLTGKRDSNQLFASITIKNNNATFEQDNWSITPYGKASASYTELDKFSESGASTALTFYKQTVNEAKVYIGADATYLVTLNNGTMTPFAKIEYGRDVSGGSNATMHYNSESTEYTLNLDKAAEEHWKLGIGTDIQTKDGWTGSFGYEREQAVGSGHSDSLKLDARLKF